MIRAVVFDLDDTLYLEREFAMSGYAACEEWMRGRGLSSGLAAAAAREFDARRYDRIFDRVLPALGVDPRPELIQDLIAQYRSHRPSIRLTDDAAATLPSLAKRYRLALLSDGPAITQRRKVEALQLDRWLDPIVLTDDHGGRDAWKPNVKCFRVIEEATGLSGSDLAYVADNPAKDFAGPKALGWHRIRIRRPLAIHRDVPVRPEDEVTTEISSLAELAAYLQ